MWRPEGWEEIKLELCKRQGGYFNPDTPIWIKDDLLLVEAGADAMLEALRKQPRVKYQNYATPNPSFPFPATYYLIPDEV